MRSTFRHFLTKFERKSQNDQQIHIRILAGLRRVLAKIPERSLLHKTSRTCTSLILNTQFLYFIAINLLYFIHFDLEFSIIQIFLPKRLLQPSLLRKIFLKFRVHRRLWMSVTAAQILEVNWLHQWVLHAVSCCSFLSVAHFNVSIKSTIIFIVFWR